MTGRIKLLEKLRRDSV
jgi:hypothetical protein